MKKKTKKRHVRRVIEWSAHLVLLITIIVVVTRFVVNSPEESFAGLSKGDVIEPMEQYINEEDDATVLIALSPTCPYCLHSMPFYRKLEERRSVLHQPIRIVAAVDSNSSARAQEEILRKANVKVDTLVVLSLSNSKIYGVPSVVLLNNKAKTENVWRGLLTEDREEEVLSTLGLIQDGNNIDS